MPKVKVGKKVKKFPYTKKGKMMAKKAMMKMKMKKGSKKKKK